VASVPPLPESGAQSGADDPSPHQSSIVSSGLTYTPVYEVTAEHLRAAFEAAATWLELQAASVNALNVFPVPDGDTGTNMSMTMRAAAEAAAVERASEAGAVARAAARGALMGARGNSGVILSQLMRGFAEGVDAQQARLSVAQLATGLEQAAQVAYGAVGKPVEGTILTVARRAGEEARRAVADGPDVASFWERVVRMAERAVAETPDQLEALRNAGVVDAGGQGYRLIVEAFWRTARGESIESLEAAPVASQALVAAQHVGEGGLGFCTEFLVEHATDSIATMRAYMESLGDSVIVVGDGHLTRVHVHTMQPGHALDWAVERGAVSRIKIENMQLQHDAGNLQPESGRGGLSTTGVVTIAPGAGFRALFSSMGAAAIISGGQTMNPSVQEILAAVESVGYRELILLPNNGNILLAAQQAAEASPRTLRVVPTRTVPQGIAALLAFNYQADLETNVALMEEAASLVASIEVTRAARPADVDGLHIEAGQYVGLLDDALVAVDEDHTAVALATLAKAEPERRELVTIYWGEGASWDDAVALCEAIGHAYPNLEAEVVEGGQPHYPYIISVE
jgi:DAK2 domain fusion protein YloV